MPPSPIHRVAVAVVHRAGRWLVARRRAEAHLGGLWEFPGGKFESSETPGEAALRELREESGIEAHVDRVLGQLRHDYPDRTIELTPVLCRWTAGEAQPIASAECRWVTIEELRALDMPAMNAAILRELA